MAVEEMEPRESPDDAAADAAPANILSSDRRWAVVSLPLGSDSHGLYGDRKSAAEPRFCFVSIAICLPYYGPVAISPIVVVVPSSLTVAF